MASTYLTRTLVNSNQKKFTISVWLKRSKLGSQQSILGVGGGGAYATNLYFDGNDKIDFWNYFNSAYQGRKVTNRKFRDTNSWYHIVAAVDTTSAQSTADDRMKIYVNGVRETSFSTSSNPNQDQTFEFNSNSVHQIGRNSAGQEFDGSMSHFHFVDGSQLEPTVFGETDSTTGEWKIKTSPSYTVGTNGFWVLKDGNSVTDSSTNSNNFTVAAGTLSKTEDNPSNVFATMNPLNIPTSNAPSFSNGNTTSISSSSGSGKWGGSSTLGMTSGKFYIEAKATVGSPSRSVIGITGDARNMARGNGSPYGSDQNSSGWYSDNGQVNWNNSAAYTGPTYTTGDIVQIAIDLDNNRLFYGKNNTWLNSGDPTSSTGAITIASASSCNDGAYFICQADDTGTSVVSKFEFNFGNGYFGTTEITTSTGSGFQDEDGNGRFYYDPPTNYRCLSTKGLNQ
tara:strand:- start:31 stop:1386 length:1356 start_codon:yes stop_codon:yes gene_type:complete